MKINTRKANYLRTCENLSDEQYLKITNSKLVSKINKNENNFEA
jgi:hypothetical protein